ncbi:MAG TPA: ABC transporter permease [Terriglobales bacterium]|nr:ABC transporter permease [Terriglobales bacterium]
MHRIFDIVRQSLSTLWAHKLRSFLTMFGIAWGVGSLLLLVGLGEGFRSGNRKQLDSLGPDIMFLFGGRLPAVEGSLNSMRPYKLTYADYVAVKNEATLVRHVSPVVNREDIRAVSEYNSTNGQVFGVAASYNLIRTLPIMTGRWISEGDELNSRRVAVLGKEMMTNLYSGRAAVGTHILLNGVPFDVIGVLPKIGKENFNGTNIRIFVPISTMRELFPLKEANSEEKISFLNYQPLTRDEHDAAKQQVHSIIARLHGFDPNAQDVFDEWDTVESERRVGLIFDAMDIFLGAVGLVTLALGAIGIINIMLVSVSERTREIGLRKALGATNRNILAQFFLEGAFLTLLSGAIGVAVISGFMSLLKRVPIPEGFDPPRIVPQSAVVAIVCLSLAGIISGLYPARKAAMLEPVEALRQE